MGDLKAITKFAGYYYNHASKSYYQIWFNDREFIKKEWYLKSFLVGEGITKVKQLDLTYLAKMNRKEWETRLKGRAFIYDPFTTPSLLFLDPTKPISIQNIKIIEHLLEETYKFEAYAVEEVGNDRILNKSTKCSVENKGDLLSYFKIFKNFVMVPYMESNTPLNYSFEVKEANHEFLKNQISELKDR